MSDPVKLKTPPMPLFSLSKSKETLKRWGGKVEWGINWVGDKVEYGINFGLKKITSEDTAKRITGLAMRILRGIPVAAAMFLLPTPVAFGIIVGGLMIDVIKPGVLGKKWSFRMYQSFGLHTAIRTVMDSVRVACMNNAFFYLGLLAVDVASTAYCYWRIEKF